MRQTFRSPGRPPGTAPLPLDKLPTEPTAAEDVSHICLRQRPLDAHSSPWPSFSRTTERPSQHRRTAASAGYHPLLSDAPSTGFRSYWASEGLHQRVFGSLFGPVSHTVVAKLSERPLNGFFCLPRSPTGSTGS